MQRERGREGKGSFPTTSPAKTSPEPVLHIPVPTLKNAGKHWPLSTSMD